MLSDNEQKTQDFPEAKKPRKHRGMSHRHELFCNAYLVTGNATTSALEAGFKSAGAYQQGHRLLKRPDVTATIERLKQERNKEIQANRIARVNALRDKDQWLAEVLIVYENIKNPESPQKLKSLELAGKSLGHLSEKDTLNLFQIDNRTLNNQVEITSEALKIADKLKMLQNITLSIPVESTQVLSPKEVTIEQANVREDCL